MRKKHLGKEEAATSGKSREEKGLPARFPLSPDWRIKYVQRAVPVTTVAAPRFFHPKQASLSLSASH